LISRLLNKNTRHPLNTLQFVSLLYLGIPIVLFFVSWLKWYYALCLIILILAPFLNFSIEFSRKGIRKFFTYFLVVGLFLILQGYGEILPQSGDWGKHNAILSQLFNHGNQPVYIPYKGVDHILCYGLGFYMVPVFLAGIFKSYMMMKWLILLNSAIGLTLVGFWANRIWKTPLWAIILVFLLGSLDWIKDLKWFLINYESGWDIFYTIGNLQILSTIDQTPQHGIPTFLVFVIILDQLFTETPMYLLCLYILVIGFFWSPFLIFALLPLMVLIKINDLQAQINLPLLLITIPILAVGYFLVCYYQMHIPVGKATLDIPGLKWMIYEFITRYTWIYGIPLAFIFIINWKLHFIRTIEIKLIASFLFISIIYKQVNYGFFNDFEGKTTYLILFILYIYMLKGTILYFSSFNLVSKVAVCFFVFICSFMSLKVIWMKILAFGSETYFERFDCNVHLLSTKPNIKLENALEKATEVHNYPFIIQYLGEMNTVSSEIFKPVKR